MLSVLMKRPRETQNGSSTLETRPNKRGRPGKDEVETQAPEPKKIKTQEVVTPKKKEKSRRIKEEKVPPPPPPLEEASPSPKKAPAAPAPDLNKLTHSELVERVKKAEEKAQEQQQKTKVAEIRLAVLENLLRDAKSREHNLEQQKEQVDEDLKLQRARRVKAENEMGEHIDALEELDKKAKKQANAATATKSMMFFQEVQYAKALLLAQNCVQKLERQVLEADRKFFEAEARHIKDRLRNESQFELLLFAKLDENARREQAERDDRDRESKASRGGSDRDSRRSSRKGGGITMNIPTTRDYLPHMMNGRERNKDASPDFAIKGQSTRNPPDVTGLLKNSRKGSRDSDPSSTKRKPSQAELTAMHQIARATDPSATKDPSSSLWGGGKEIPLYTPVQARERVPADGLTEQQRAGLRNLDRLASAWLGTGAAL